MIDLSHYLPFANYIFYLAMSTMLLLVFFIVYTRVTPIDEVLMIRQGNHAAALSLGGALLGFSMTVASCAFHTSRAQDFLIWAFAAMVVQILVYVIVCKLLKISKEQIESGNAAFGALIGVLSLSIGMINAACIS